MPHGMRSMKTTLTILSSIFLLSTLSCYSNAKDHTAKPRPVITNNGEDIIIYPAKKVITMESALKECYRGFRQRKKNYRRGHSCSTQKTGWKIIN